MSDTEPRIEEKEIAVGEHERFVPELGQAVFSNTPWTETPMDDFVEAGIAQIGGMLEEYGLTPANCADNSGGSYESETFTIRAYCWCDGAVPHQDGCPPNFQCGDFFAFWYKHVGRSATQSRRLTRGEWHEIYDKCVRSILKPAAPAQENAP